MHIVNPWFDQLNKMPNTERDAMAKRNLGNSQYSRLASCVQIKKDLNEMIVVVGNNQSTNGEWFTG